MKILEMKFEQDDKTYSWHTDHDGKGGMLFSAGGSTLATLERDNASKLWLVRNWDGAKKNPEAPSGYDWPEIGRAVHWSRFRIGDALAMASHTVRVFVEHGWRT